MPLITYLNEKMLCHCVHIKKEHFSERITNILKFASINGIEILLIILNYCLNLKVVIFHFKVMHYISGE